MRARPVITELPLTAGQTVIAFTDGFTLAGTRKGNPLDLATLLAQPGCCLAVPAQQIADLLLETALALEENRPADDITIVVVQVVESRDDDGPEVRRMSVSFPVPPV
jgi:serine phosphatase RsbU (regulator of sigma subunit)